MVTYWGLAAIVTGIVALVAITVVASQLFLTYGERARCSRCGATLAEEGEDCTVCEAPMAQPQPTGTGGNGRGTIEVDESQLPTKDPEAGALNPGVSERMVRWALIVMFAGIGVRLLGMLEPVGLDVGLSQTVKATFTTLTVIGGVAMFLAFVVLDLA
jgi:hypothetical protein